MQFKNEIIKIIFEEISNINNKDISIFLKKINKVLINDYINSDINTQTLPFLLYLFVNVTNYKELSGATDELNIVNNIYYNKIIINKNNISQYKSILNYNIEPKDLFTKLVMNDNNLIKIRRLLNIMNIFFTKSYRDSKDHYSNILNLVKSENYKNIFNYFEENNYQKCCDIIKSIIPFDNNYINNNNNNYIPKYFNSDIGNYNWLYNIKQNKEFVDKNISNNGIPSIYYYINILYTFNFELIKKKIITETKNNFINNLFFYLLSYYNNVLLEKYIIARLLYKYNIISYFEDKVINDIFKICDYNYIHNEIFGNKSGNLFSEFNLNLFLDKDYINDDYVYENLLLLLNPDNNLKSINFNFDNDLLQFLFLCVTNKNSYEETKQFVIKNYNYLQFNKKNSSIFINLFNLLSPNDYINFISLYKLKDNYGPEIINIVFGSSEDKQIIKFFENYFEISKSNNNLLNSAVSINSNATKGSLGSLKNKQDEYFEDDISYIQELVSSLKENNLELFLYIKKSKTFKNKKLLPEEYKNYNNLFSKLYDFLNILKIKNLFNNVNNNISTEFETILDQKSFIDIIKIYNNLFSIIDPSIEFTFLGINSHMLYNNKLIDNKFILSLFLRFEYFMLYIIKNNLNNIIIDDDVEDELLKFKIIFNSMYNNYQDYKDNFNLQRIYKRYLLIFKEIF